MTASGRVFVGPDNGLLVPAAERAGIEGAWALENAAYRLERVSRTFHGRDVFAPAVAHLATGVTPEELGPALEPASLVRLDLPEAEIRDGEIRAMVLLVDRYGNAQLNLSPADLERAGIAPGEKVEIGTRMATVAHTFADALEGELILYEDAYERMAIAIAGGNAAEMLSVRPGDGLAIASK